MAVEKSYTRLGLFIVISLIVVLATVVLIIQRLKRHEVILMVTYTMEDVSGLRGAALVVVNQTLARRYYPNGDIAGHAKVPALQASPPDWLTAPGADDWMQVIGVVGDSVNDGLDHPVRPEIFALTARSYRRARGF